MENTLQRKDCRLMQSGKFKKNIKITDITDIKSIIDLHYMGPAEFEQGALPKSTTRMLVNIDFYDIFTFPEYRNQNGREMKVYAPRMFIDHITDAVHKLAAGNISLQIPCSLPEYLKDGEQLYRKTDFWWDIENDFYIFFGDYQANMILKSQLSMRKKSIGKVEVGDWKQLSEYYFQENPDLNQDALDFLRPEKSK